MTYEFLLHTSYGICTGYPLAAPSTTHSLRAPHMLYAEVNCLNYLVMEIKRSVVYNPIENKNFK